MGDPTRPMALTRWVVASTFSLLLIGALVAFNSSERTLPSDGSSFDVQDPTSELFSSARSGLNVVKENAPGVGGWGGSCTCPDGSTYWVGDKNDACRSMACYGGTRGTCNRYASNQWKGREVICAATANPTASPTANPTESVAPSDTPTAAPSDTPAAAPSDTPTAAPSAEHMTRRRR